MLVNSDFNIVKNAALLVFLLVLSMAVQAQDSDAAVTTASNPAVNTAEAQAAEAAVTSASEDQQRTFSFPRWPENRQINRERLPLAPPGPYMSSALSDFPVRESPFDRDRNRRAFNADSSDASMEMFSPDIPWPSHAKSPARWIPDNGYRYIGSHVEKKPYQVMPQNLPSDYSYGYRRNPVLNWSDNEAGRRSRNPVMNGYTH